MDNFNYLIKTRELYNLAEQLSQNKNTKREITDISISKIPYIVYPDLDINQSLIIHELAEFLLKEAKNRNNHNEVAITYDLDNNLSIKNGLLPILEKSGVCEGTTNEVDIFSDTKTMSTIYRAKNIAVINLHNHPSCSSFSVQDISVFLNETAIKLMVVIGNNGELFYLSKNLDKYNFITAFKYFTDIINVIHPIQDKEYKWTNAELREVADIFLKNSINFGIDYKHVLGTDKELKQINEDKDWNEDER
jgi:hypothetical protein